MVPWWRYHFYPLITQVISVILSIRESAVLNESFLKTKWLSKVRINFSSRETWLNSQYYETVVPWWLLPRCEVTSWWNAFICSIRLSFSVFLLNFRFIFKGFRLDFGIGMCGFLIVNFAFWAYFCFGTWERWTLSVSKFESRLSRDWLEVGIDRYKWWTLLKFY